MLREAYDSMKKPQSNIKDSVWCAEYNEIKEDDFLPIVTKTKNVVCHFFHKEFDRCKILDQHLKNLCSYHPETAFIKLEAEKSPFFINKL